MGIGFHISEEELEEMRKRQDSGSIGVHFDENESMDEPMIKHFQSEEKEDDGEGLIKHFKED